MDYKPKVMPPRKARGLAPTKPSRKALRAMLEGYAPPTKRGASLGRIGPQSMSKGQD
jgi:hypothetical protein